jgi:hypothetical protein
MMTPTTRVSGKRKKKKEERREDKEVTGQIQMRVVGTADRLPSSPPRLARKLSGDKSQASPQWKEGGGEGAQEQGMKEEEYTAAVMRDPQK